MLFSLFTSTSTVILYCSIYQHLYRLYYCTVLFINIYIDCNNVLFYLSTYISTVICVFSLSTSISTYYCTVLFINIYIDCNIVLIYLSTYISTVIMCCSIYQHLYRLYYCTVLFINIYINCNIVLFYL